MTKAGSGTNLTRSLVRFAHGFRLAGMPEAVLMRTRYVLLDTIGVAAAAWRNEIARLVSAHAAGDAGAGKCTIIGGSGTCAAGAAALVNGTLANAIDYDEGSHVATVALPAALACAEQENAGAQAFLETFAMAFEAGSRLKECVDGARDSRDGPTQRGWWHMGLIGPLISALAAARLMKLDEEASAHALAIAACSSGGFRTSFGTMSKAFHSGNAARAGIEAARLAASGFRGDPAVLDGTPGILEAICAPDSANNAALLEGPAHCFALEAPAKIKVMPVCTAIAPALDALLALQSDYAIAPDSIARVDADLQIDTMIRWRPDTMDAVPFCSPFLIASALVHRAMTLDAVSTGAIASPQVRALMERVHHDSEAGKTVAITLHDGTRVQAEQGGVKRLATLDEIANKFRQCSAGVYSDERAGMLIDSVMRLEELDHIPALSGG